MCLVLNFSKYIFVPILTEWLTGKELILFHLSLAKTDCDMMQCIIDSHKKIFQDQVFSVFGISCFSHHMLRWVKARNFNMDDFKLTIDPCCNPKDFLAITSEIGFNDRTLKTKFDCMSVVKKLEVRDVNNAKESNVVSRLFQCFKNIEVLTVRCCATYDRLAFHCLNLRRIEITEANRYLFKFNVVFRLCKKLEHLGVYAGYIKKKVDDDSKIRSFIFALLVHADSLVSLTFMGLWLQTANSLFNLFGTRKKLTHFCLEQNAYFVGVPTFLWYNGFELQQLRLTSCGTPWCKKDIGRMCPNLTSLALDNSTRCSDCIEVLTSLKHLKHFKCSSWLDVSTIPALAACSNLETLSVTPHWSSEALEGVYFHWENLTELSLSAYNRVSWPMSCVLDSCSQLKKLTLNGCWDKVDYLVTSLEVFDVLCCHSYLVDARIVSNFPSLRVLYCSANQCASMAWVLGTSVKVFHSRPESLMESFL